MEVILFLSVGIIVGLLVAIFVAWKQKPKGQSESLMMLQQQMQQVTKVLDDRLSESHKTLQTQFGQSAKIIQNVTERLTKLDETNRQVMGFAEQLQLLQNTLTNPKQRGILGEYYLEELLKNVFSPGQYQMQYKFKDGQIVDAVLFVRENKIIPIDSKFSLETYNRILEEKDKARREELELQLRRDLKERIDETAKYIRPNENTLELAFMFIPAEAVYYDLLVNKIGTLKGNTRDLIDYAVREKHVIPVSPTSFYAYLQTILQGLRAMQIEKSAQEIRKRVEMLSRHLLNYEEYLKRLGNNLGTAVNAYNASYKEFGKIDKDVVKITEGESQVEIQQLEKPSQD